MKLYEELVARGLIAQVTDEEKVREMIDNGKAVFYIGFDPTADSLLPLLEETLHYLNIFIICCFFQLAPQA